jgi:flagellar basal-body rod protein FlgB
MANHRGGASGEALARGAFGRNLASDKKLARQPPHSADSKSPQPAGRMQGANGMLDRVTTDLEKYMDLLAARQKLVAANIANADTPGYRTQDIDFQTEFRNATAGAVQVLDVVGLPMKNDGNNVSLDREARLLAENSLRFQLATNLLRSQLQTVKSAIDEGKSS